MHLVFVEATLIPLSPGSPSYLRLCKKNKTEALIDLMGVHSHVHQQMQHQAAPEEWWGCGGHVKQKKLYKGHQIRALPSDCGYEGIDGNCVGVCVSVGYDPLCHEMLLGKKKKLCGPCGQVEIYSHPEDHYC